MEPLRPGIPGPHLRPRRDRFRAGRLREAQHPDRHRRLGAEAEASNARRSNSLRPKEEVLVKATLKLSTVFILTALAFSSAPAWAGDTPAGVLPGTMRMGDTSMRERVWTWDVNVDGALGKFSSDSGSSRWTGFGRVRAGVMRIHDLLYLSLGPTYEISDRQVATFGLQGEIMHLRSGLWCQGGLLLD